jgi:hypothetical protein
MAKRGHKKTKRAAEVSAAIVIVLGLGAGALGVMLYNHNKQTTATPPSVPLPPIPPNAPIAPGLTFNRNPPAGPLPPPGIIGTADQHLR